MARLYSIGYGNRTWQATLTLLEKYSCQFLIDVRSSPFSKFNPDFSREHLQLLCAGAGIKYVFMGDTLGGKPSGSDSFDDDGKVDYIKVAETPAFQLGLTRLKTADQKGLVCFLICSELRPEMCHRCKLIGAELAESGIEIIHISETGGELTQDAAIKRLTGGQSEMFGTNPELTRSRGSYGGRVG